jgi:Holliday junction resolvase
MSASERRKGIRGERDLVRELRAAGIGADRVSPLEAGGVAKGDVVDGQGNVWSVKRRASSPLYGWLDGADRLALRADWEDWLVILRLDDYPDLAARAEGGDGA